MLTSVCDVLSPKSQKLGLGQHVRRHFLSALIFPYELVKWFITVAAANPRTLRVCGCLFAGGAKKLSVEWVHLSADGCKAHAQTGARRISSGSHGALYHS